jgi:hypothetical protein
MDQSTSIGLVKAEVSWVQVEQRFREFECSIVLMARIQIWYYNIVQLNRYYYRTVLRHDTLLPLNG